MTGKEIIEDAKEELKEYLVDKQMAKRTQKKVDKRRRSILSLLKQMPKNEQPLYQEKIDNIIIKL